MDVTGNVTLPEGVGKAFEMCMPGDNVKMTVELLPDSPTSPWTTACAASAGPRRVARTVDRSGVSDQDPGPSLSVPALPNRPASAWRRQDGRQTLMVDETVREHVWLECTVCRVAATGRTQKETRGANWLELNKFCRAEPQAHRDKETRK